jgi:hypothetical protein
MTLLGQDTGEGQSLNLQATAPSQWSRHCAPPLQLELQSWAPLQSASHAIARSQSMKQEPPPRQSTKGQVPLFVQSIRH